MNNNNSPKKCFAFEHALCIQASGGITPCCASVGDIDHMSNCDSLSEYWENNTSLNVMRDMDRVGIPNPLCNGCDRREALGLITRRNKFDNWYGKYMPEYSPRSIIHMDINFGNACNQKCSMCNSSYSSKWLEDDNIHRVAHPFFKSYENISTKNWSMTEDQMLQVIDLITPETRTVEIKGGEPTYHKFFSRFIEECISKNPDISIDICTNGTMLTDEVIEVLNRLKKCSLSISIDGLNDTYEWIRGYSWDKFNLSFDNLLSKYNKNFLINHTTSVYNLDRISDIYSWISHECQSRYNHRIEFNLLQIAMTPMYQNPMYASTDRLSNAIDILNYVLEDPYDIWLYSHNMKSHVLVLKNYLEKCLYYKPTDMNEANNKLSKHHLSLVHKSHDLLCSIRGWDLQERVGYELFRK